jgi:hypothetical protein
MNILALALLVLGALAVLISAPFALFMPYRAMDDTDHPVWRYLSVAVFFVLPLGFAWCVYRAWQWYQAGDYSASAQYAAFPAGGLILAVGVIALATKLTKKNSP